MKMPIFWVFLPKYVPLSLFCKGAFMPRFFLSSDNIAYPIKVGDRLYIRGGDALHISSVLRMNSGDIIVVCDMKRCDYRCRILSASKDMTELCIEDIVPCKNEPELETVLFQGIVKGDKMDTVIQKAVELGVTKIVPVECERSVVKLSCEKAKTRVERWQKIAYEAAKQCGRGIIPEVSGVISFDECAKALCTFDVFFACYEGEMTFSVKNIICRKDYNSCAFLIGPEGGISNPEIKLLQKFNIPCVSLGKLILRTETAGAAVLSMLLYERQL